MITTQLKPIACILVVAAAGFLARAYPPAPHHLVYGSVRDELGNPLVATNAEVMLETLQGVQLRTPVTPNAAPGVNYRLPVPMDAGLTADTYKPTAMKPTLPFRMKVKLGGVTHLPLEMAATPVNLGQPAQSTRIDLTLGVDSDGDGLPDAWERALLTGDMTLADVKPGDDADGDGLSNLQEYLAGTYAFDSSDALKLNLVRDETGRDLIEFLAISGRSYSLHGSADMKNWAPLEFRLASDGNDGPIHTYYQATDVRTVRLQPLSSGGALPQQLFLRAHVQ